MPTYTSQIMEIPSGDEGTRRTLEIMRTAVTQGMKDPAILPIARLIVSDAPEKDQWAEAVRLFYFCKDGIRYVKDPYDLEGVLFPRTVLSIGSGDCDDKTVAFSALAMSIGIPARFCAVKLAGKDQYSHVYPELFIKGAWIPFELTLKRAVPGVSYAEPSQKMRLEVSPDIEESPSAASVVGRFVREIINGNAEADMYSGTAGFAALGQTVQTPSWYQDLQSWFSQWSSRMQQISNILKETPNIPSYAQTGEQVSATKQTFTWWMEQPYTWVAVAALAFAVYKLRTAR